MTDKSNTALLVVEGLKKFFPIRKGLFGKTIGELKAVDNVSFTVRIGKTLGLVGESGCGKTTTGRSIIRLIEPTAGRIVFDGLEVQNLRGSERRNIHRRMQIVFQDPYSSLNPRITVGGMVSEILRFHRIVERKSINEKVAEILENVGLSMDYAGRYPHEFSGGQRQRIGIARALSVEPDFVVLDEPVSALDVSIQAQILNLLMDLQQKLRLTYLFVAHDLSVVEHVADEIAVMYLGRVVEVGSKEDVINNPLHPYTQALLEAVPQPDPDKRRDRKLLHGDVPSPAAQPSGCHFHPRCPKVRPACSEWEFELKDVGNRRDVACLLY